MINAICKKCNAFIGDCGYVLDDYGYVYHNFDCFKLKDSYNKWPTLEGRLSYPITTELEALQQLEKSVPLSDYAKERLKKLLKD